MRHLVCDTGPLNYLIQIGAAELLPVLFEEVLVPQSVYQELTAPAAPPLVREWVARVPAWCSVVAKTIRLQGEFPGLADADLDVLSLAADSRSAVFCDDLAARKAARRLGLPLLGTLGFLELASSRKLLNLSDSISSLKKTNIRLSEDLYREVLSRNGFDPE